MIALTFMTRRVNSHLGIFHFRGVWAGKLVKQLQLSNIEQYDIQLEKEYVLHLSQVEYCQDKKTILARIVKVRALNT